MPDGRSLFAIPSDFWRFAATGVAGFGVDAGILLALTQGAGLLPQVARLGSFAVAVLATWTIHRAWTFRAADGEASRPAGRQLASYFGVQLAGAVLNYLIFTLLIGVLGDGPVNLVLSLACGSVGGLLLTYAGSRAFVFRRSGDPAV